jgi:hypothetical protein
MKSPLWLRRVLLSAAALLLMVSHVHSVSASALGNLAASMQPGTFAELTPMTGWNSGGILSPTDLGGCTTSDYITQYADKAAWDPVNGRVLYVGTAHGDCWGGRFVSYTDSTNTWGQLPWMPGLCQSGTDASPCWTGHGYDHNTVDPATGDFYWRAYNSLKIVRFHNGSWLTVPPPPAGSHQCCGALEFFPAMGKLIFLDGDWGLWAFDPAKNSWAQLANTNVANATAGLPNLPMSSTTDFALYDPVTRILLFGGGSGLYSMDSTGKIVAKKTPPVTLGATQAVASVDSVGGKFLVLSGSSMYQYDATSDSWSQLAVTVPSVLMALNGVGDGLVAVDVTTYGVIMYIKYDVSSSKVYIYKHSASAAVKSPVPPAPVTPEPPTDVTVH